MSSILKALKRLEEEKAAREGEKVVVAGGILRGSVSMRQPSHGRLIVAVIVVMVLSVVSTYAILKGFKPSRAVPDSSQAAVNQPSPASSPSAATASEGVKVSPVSQEPVTRKTGRISEFFRAATINSVSPQTVNQPAKASQPGSPEPTPTRQSPVESAPVPEPKAVVTAVTPTVVASFPSLKVSGIAWQKDSQSAVAVVNGTAVGKGGTVSGARVEDVFPDRVKFSFEGKMFDVPLGKGNSDR